MFKKYTLDVILNIVILNIVILKKYTLECNT